MVYTSTSINVPGGTIVYIRQNGSDIQYSLDQNVWTTIIFLIGCDIQNTNTSLGFVKVYFITDLNITDINQFFSCDTDYIQIGCENLKMDGSRPVINVSVNNYTGFVKNNNSNNNICIFNLIVNGTGFTTSMYGGWILQANAYNVSSMYIINCSSNGNIGDYGGGIIGYVTGSIHIIGCSSSGNIGNYAGGISAMDCDGLMIDYCWSTGNISGIYAGGIIGQNTNNCQINYCYSTGVISGVSAGGIAGLINRNNINININACYSRGDINGQFSGGICSGTQNITTTTVIINITNCYSTGNINSINNAGGMVGLIYQNSVFNISNCYIAGQTNTTKGYLIGSNSQGDENVSGSGYTINNCYSEAYHGNSGWNDQHSSTVLLGSPTSLPGVGTVWVSINANTPYSLLNMGYTPYSIYNIYNQDLVRNITSSIKPGQSTPNAILNSLSYRILQITGGNPNSYNTISIDTNTGFISTTGSTTAGVYTIYVYNNGYNGSYDITTVILIVNEKIISMKSLYTDNSLVYYKLHSLSSGGGGTVKNCRIKARKT